MPGRVRTRRTRWFRLAALAGFAISEAEQAVAAEVSRLAGSASRSPVRAFKEHDLPILAQRALLIKRPDLIPAHAEVLLFTRHPRNIPPLVQALRNRRYVLRVDRVSGAFDVIAEVFAPNREDLDALAEEFEADARLILLDRTDRTHSALSEAAADVFTEEQA